jgi:REP element-mobilizing transposase RayT
MPTIKPRKNSLRLKGYDYSQPGPYFVTLLVENRQHIFGDILDGTMKLSKIGEIAEKRWLEIPDHYPAAEIDTFVIMPNHVHGIIHINQINQNKPRSQTRNLVTPSFNYNTIVRAQDSAPLQIKPRLGKIIGGYKIGVTKWVRKNTNLHTIWQRSFFDQVVRNDIQLERIRTYIRNNQSSHDSPQANVSFH